MTTINSSPFAVQVLPDTALSRAAGTLEPGEWVADPITWNPQSSQWDISWQNRTAFWDEVHREIQYMGKAQGGGAARHFIYAETTDSWRPGSLDAAPNKLGHIWMVTFDHSDEPGDYYYVEQDVAGPAGDDLTNSIRHFRRAIEDGAGPANDPWGRLTDATTFQLWSTSDTPNPGMCFHPNLFGPGQPGIYCWATGGAGGTGFAHWNKATNAWTQVAPFGLGDDYGDRNASSSLYVPGHDICIFGCGANGSQDALIIQAGDADNPAPALVPLPVRVQSGTSGGAHMLRDPRDSTVVMLLERQGDRVWTNANGGQSASWVLEPFTHPFWTNLPRYDIDAGSWTPCAVTTYGVVLGMSSYSGAGGTLLWRPGS